MAEQGKADIEQMIKELEQEKRELEQQVLPWGRVGLEATKSLLHCGRDSGEITIPGGGITTSHCSRLL